MLVLKLAIGLLVLVGLLGGIAFAGTKVKPRRFDTPAHPARDLGTIPIPADLPAPVARYAEAVFVDGTLPVTDSALFIGYADTRLNGLGMPVRFKIYHDAGRAYYHYLQVTWFGLPVLTINERYLDGVGMMELPGELIENDAQINHAANLGLWAESIWLPTVWFADERVQWQAVDDHTAHLIVPDAAPEEVFTVYFDPATGLIERFEALRWRNKGDAERVLWTNTITAWQTVNGVQVPAVAETQWANDDRPWAIWHVETLLTNVDVSQRFAQFGGDVD